MLVFVVLSLFVLVVTRIRCILLFLLSVACHFIVVVLPFCAFVCVVVHVLHRLLFFGWPAYVCVVLFCVCVVVFVSCVLLSLLICC